MEAVAEAAGESGVGGGGAGEAATHNSTSPSVRAAVFEVLHCDGDRYSVLFFIFYFLIEKRQALRSGLRGNSDLCTRACVHNT